MQAIKHDSAAWVYKATVPIDKVNDWLRDPKWNNNLLMRGRNFVQLTRKGSKKHNKAIVKTVRRQGVYNVCSVAATEPVTDSGVLSVQYLQCRGLYGCIAPDSKASGKNRPKCMFRLKVEVLASDTTMARIFVQHEGM